MSKVNWTEELTASLSAIVGADMNSEVSTAVVESAAESLGVPAKNVGSKLRNMGYTTEKKSAAASWPVEDSDRLSAFLEGNVGTHTTEQVANQLFGDKYTAAQVGGKALSLKLRQNFKKVEPKVVPAVYDDNQTAIVVKLAKEGKSIEDIAAAVDKSTNSVRGKCLSLLQKEIIAEIPFTANKVEPKGSTSPIDAVENLSGKTVAEIAEEAQRTERGVKAFLTNRGLICQDWDGAARKAKAQAKKEAKLAA